MIELHGTESRNGRWRLGPLEYQSPHAGCVALVGHNGAGKSTLMRTIVGLQRPYRGRVSVDGLDPFNRSQRTKLYGRLGYVAQSTTLPARATVSETLRYGAWLKGIRPAEVEEAVRRAAMAADVSSYLGRRNGQLSEGTQRRVSIALGLIHDPVVLILDEPSAGLDPVQRVDLQTVVKDLARSRLVMLSTHLVEDIAAVAEHVLAVRDGISVYTGTVMDLEGSNGDPTNPMGLQSAIFRLLKRDES